MINNTLIISTENRDQGYSIASAKTPTSMVSQFKFKL